MYVYLLRASPGVCTSLKPKAKTDKPNVQTMPYPQSQAGGSTALTKHSQADCVAFTDWDGNGMHVMEEILII